LCFQRSIFRISCISVILIQNIAYPIVDLLQALEHRTVHDSPLLWIMRRRSADDRVDRWPSTAVCHCSSAEKSNPAGSACAAAEIHWSRYWCY